MKKYLVCLLALMLCIGFTFVVPASAEEAKEVHSVVLSDAESYDEWNAYKFYNVTLNNKYVKQGDTSIRVETVHGQLVFLLEFDEPKDVSMIDGTKYLEMWIYVVNAVQCSKSTTAQIELSSQKENNTDSYFWNMVGYQYQNGWNHLSIELKDEYIYGNPDLTSLKSLRYTIFVPVQAAIYVDDVRITNTPRNVSQTELYVIEQDAPYTKVTVEPTAISVLSVITTVLMVLAIVAVVAFVVVMIITLVNKKGGKVDEDENE